MGRSPAVILTLLAAAAAVVYMMLPEQHAAQDWATRRALFQGAAARAEPLTEAIRAYTSALGHPPGQLADLVPGYMPALPATGVPRCKTFEYRRLADRPVAIVWYDLGSRHGQAPARPSRYSAGDPGHAILVFTLDAEDKVASALIDRLPKVKEPVAFDTGRWKAGASRLEMAPALAETYRLHGMPRPVFEQLLGPPDGSRILQHAPWELRINCPTGLLNHDVFVYWPTEQYPVHLYGGTTESIGRWVYVHS